MSKLREALDAWGDRIKAEAPPPPRRAALNTGDCLAYQMSDGMFCKCGRTYDVNDPDPPTCPMTGRPARASGSSRA